MKDPMASPSTSDDEEEEPSSSSSSSSSSQSQEDSASSQDSEEQTHSSSRRDNAPPDSSITLPAPPPPPEAPRRRRRITYDEQKRRDWNTFLGYLETQKPRLTLSLLHSADVIDFLKYIDGFGKTLIHLQGCPFFGCPDPPIAPCGCPLRQSWGSLDGLVRRLRAACEEAPSHPKINPFGARPVRNYLLHVKDAQATARGIPYSRIRKSRFPPSDDSNAASATLQPPPPPPPPAHDDQLRLPTPLPGIVPLVGSIGQDAPVQLQLCWVQQPATDNQATPSFYPIWGYPVSFLPTFPCMPIPNPERPKNKKTRVPEQEPESEEDQPETEALGTGEEEGSSSSNEGGGSEPIQASAEHPTTSSRRRRRRNTYEEQKGKDWEVFQYFLDNREPRLTLSRVRSTHVIEFLEAIDQYGKTLVHESGCPYFGQPKPAAPCPCPLRQSWGTLDGLVRRLRAACEENPSCPDPNPFGVRAIRDYLLHVKDIQATARGIPYSRKRRRNLPTPDTALTEVPSESTPLGISTDQRDSSAVDVTAAASSTTNLVGEGPGALPASSSSAP